MNTRSEGDWGQTELDAAERAEAEINLDDPTAGDDEPWSPPDRQPRGAELAEVEDESLSVRLRQEEPDLDVFESESESRLGGDDPDAIRADEDVLGGDSYGEDDSVDLDDEPGPEAAAMHLES
ncbi:hypothetical protein [Nocardioides sp.]|uniref:hypothetical protein n=1 Tax=Nocardioides sp. TaxID=35761 RepID=UPI00286E6F3C|nr:hypothetical protein [Nocardioides sp.]